MLSSSSLLKKEKNKKKRKLEVIGGEGDENDDVKNFKKWLWIDKGRQENRNEVKSEVI